MVRRTALIATLPKSGTWYSHNFFWCYEQLLKRKDAYLKGAFTPDLLAVLQNKSIPNPSSHRSTLGIEKLFICHTICPGFLNSASSRNDLWKALSFPLPYNWGETFLRNYGSWEQLDPAENPDARIVYLYRNPLDHFVSYYRHTQNHIDTNHRFKMLSDGTHTPIESLHDFVFGAGMLGAFIKHYYSFRQMQRRYPGQVLLVSYEHLTLHPSQAFAEILTFMDASPDSAVKERLFEDALALCSKDSLISIESQLNRSMVGDQLGDEKHIRSGEIGKWKQHFNDGEIEKIESAFHLFDMTLADFNLLGEDSWPQDLSWLAAIDPVKKQAHQIDFLEHQRVLADFPITWQMHRQITGMKGWLHRAKAGVLQSLRHTPLARPLRAIKYKINELRLRSSPDTETIEYTL